MNFIKKEFSLKNYIFFKYKKITVPEEFFFVSYVSE